MNIIELDDVWKIYKMGEVEVRALRGLSLKVKPGEFLAVMGPSGSGKSTAMNMIGCLDIPTKGKVLLEGQNIWERSEELLELVGLSQRGHHYPSQLSGGQSQRVAIARALSTYPSLILADEPTGNLDTEAGKEVLDIFSELNARGVTVVMITHDEKIAAKANQIVRMVDGKLAA